VARYESYVQQANGKPRSNWATMPEVMLATAAERQALGKAFPLQPIPRERQATDKPGGEGVEG